MPLMRFAQCLQRLGIIFLLSGGCLQALAFGQPLTLPDLYDLALQHDPVVKAARAAEDASAERLPQALAQIFPKVVLSAERHFNQLTRESGTLDYNSINRTLQVRQPIFRSGFQASVNQARAARTEASALREHAERDLLSRLSAALFEYLLALQHKDFVKALLASTGQQLVAAELALKAGSGVRTDIDEARARLDSAKVQELQVGLQIQSSRRQLERLTGQSIREVVSLAADDPWTLMPSLPELAFWLADAELSHPQLMALRARVESAELEVKKAEAAAKPTLDALARLSRSQGESVFNPAANYSHQQIGFQFNWPIYQGGGQESAVREALAKLDEASHRLLATRDDLASRLESQYRAVYEGQLRIEALRQAQFSAHQSLISSQRSFEAGARTRLDVMNAQMALAQSQKDLVQGRLNYLMAQIQLALLAGWDSGKAMSRIKPWFEKAGLSPQTVSRP